LVTEKSLLESKIQSKIASRKSSEEEKRGMFKSNGEIQNRIHNKAKFVTPTNMLKHVYKNQITNTLKQQEKNQRKITKNKTRIPKTSKNKSIFQNSMMIRKVKKNREQKKTNKYFIFILLLLVYLLITYRL